VGTLAIPNTTQWVSSGQVGETGAFGNLFVLSDLFGLRDQRDNAWSQESTWLSTVLSSPRDEVVVRHDEVSLSAIRSTYGQVVIAISDEQAEAISDQPRDAFPPQ